MSISRLTLAIAACFLIISASAVANESAPPDPLFQSNDVLEVRLTAPMRALLLDRPIEEELPGSFQFTNTDGESLTVNVNVRTRGKFRRDRKNCMFPPFRLNFKNSEVKGTLFHKQNKIKLVTHCGGSAVYQQTILKEYIAYRILNVMTDISFRVRLLKIVYVDSEGKRKDDERYAFLIEHKDRLAKRIGKSVLEIAHTPSRGLDPEYMNLISVYHYLIANTDFSPITGPSGESCCHNHVLFGNENEKTWSVPYDFDQAGLVDSPYAAPAPRFKIRSVQQRLYRGRCYNNDAIDSTLAAYKDKKAAILATMSEVDMASKRARKEMTDFIESFYKGIDSERRVTSNLRKRCI
jgi:hypothetical protein